MSIDKDLFYESLCKTLDPRSGKILPIDKTNESGWRKVLDIEWKGGIHFMVESSKYCWGYSHVMRDGQDLSPSYCITKPDDDSIKCLQHIIDDIEDGKYRNKKTLREKIKLFVEENGLASFMNNTKWRELINDIMEKAPWDCVQYKTLFEKSAPNYFWDLRYDEDLVYKALELSEIEWMKIKHVQVISEYVGRLVPNKVQTYDHKSLFLEILQKHNIPYEYDESEQTFIVYGYRY
jgi:hypothetical protein